MSDEQDSDVDLKPEHKSYILDIHGRLDGLDCYELLGIPPTSDKKTIKRAYFEVARIIHPDRHFGKKLGTFKPKMEAIFTRVTMAFELLTDAKRREDYDARNAERLKQKGRTAAAPARPVDPKVAEARKAAMEALKQRFADGQAKAREHMKLAERARAAGDLVGVAEAYRAALTCAPNDVVIQTAYAEVQREAAARLVESHRRKAALDERWNRWEAAAQSWAHVVDAHPEDADARAHLEAARSKASKAR